MQNNLTGKTTPTALARRESRLVHWFFVPAVLTVAHYVRLVWYETGANSPNWKFRRVGAVRYAPAAYRRLFWWVFQPFLDRLGPLHIPNFLAAVDAVFLYATLWLLYRLLRRTVSESWPERTAAVGCFMAALIFPLAWIVPYQRPETTPTAMLLATALLSLTWTNRYARLALLCGYALVQGFLRADVAFVFGVTLLLFSLFHRPWRAKYLLEGALVACLSGGVQAYLQFVKYPNVTYGDVAVVQLRNNFNHRQIEFLLVAVLPVVMLLWFCLRRKLSAIEVFILAFSMLYGILWLTVGSACEVRIFVPCLLALCVVAGRVMGSYLTAVDA